MKSPVWFLACWTLAPLPFAGSARITLTNEGKQSSRHWFEVNDRAYAQPLAKPRDMLGLDYLKRQPAP